jgi:hypothetical protein
LEPEQRLASAVIRAAVHDLFSPPRSTRSDNWVRYVSAVGFFFHYRAEPIYTYWFGFFPEVDNRKALKEIQEKFRTEHLTNPSEHDLFTAAMREYKVFPCPTSYL